VGAGHSHSHGGTAAARHRGALLRTLALSGGILLVQVVGGLASGSLAVLADAGHTLTDVAGLLLALAAIGFAARPAPSHRTFGHYRVEVFSAGLNGFLLLGIALVVMYEAWQRWSEPVEIRSGLMLVVALLAVAANLAGVLMLRRGAKESITVKGAYLEVLGDLLGSVGVVVAALLVLLAGWVRADVVASVVIALLILPRALALLRETWEVLVEAAPRGVDLDEVRRHICEVPGVLDVHDLHAWTITSGMPVLSAHVVVDEEVLADGAGGRVLDLLGECLHECFEVDHCTFQLEPAGHVDHEHPGHP
jgi:cobalt-zinc-cadmium efflux system protein